MEPEQIKIGASSYNVFTGVLTSGDGHSVALRPQTAAVLRELLAHRGDVLSREDIMSRVWPTTTVTEDSVTQCIREIRASLGEEGHRLLKTFPKRGYMLEPSGIEIAADKKQGGGRRWTQLAVFIGLAALAAVASVLLWPRTAYQDERPVIVVSPFLDLYDSEKWSRIGNGLANELSAALARNDWLDVRLAAIYDANASRDAYMLNGTISAAPETLRLTARLTEGTEGRIVWSEVWEGPVNEVFAMQADLLVKVEATIAPAWTGVVARDTLGKLDAFPGTLGAFDLYLLAIEQKHLFTPEGLARSQTLLEQALAFDPEYARAWTALAVVHLLQMEGARTVESFADHLLRRITATENAYRLSPNDPETLVQVTFLMGRAGNHAAAEAALRKAAELGHNNPDILAQAAWGGARRVSVGEDAVQWALRAYELNPAPPPWYNAALATAAFYAEDYEMAAGAYAKAPPVTEVLYRHAATMAALGDMASAARLLERANAHLPEGMTIAKLEAADGATYPPYVSRLTALLDKIDSIH
ncbi:winged helix-turn-helix domain-containing protein [Sedimentitalea sp.]|uniref:winged helix-turn-helix domain-containing protein n=1 Tax=Sedimentitalea sp. TaxID=2048915 RepID=UPI0032994FA0